MRQEVFDLRQNTAKYVEVEVPMQNAGNQSIIQFKVVNSMTGNPLAVVKCTLQGHTITSHGIPQTFRKTAITNVDGIAEFTDVPLFTGEFTASHGLYKTSTRQIEHDGRVSGLKGFISLDPID